MTEIQYLILKYYHTRKEINSYEFRVNFMKLYPKYSLKEIDKEAGYLHESGFLESANNKPHTLNISTQGEEKFKAEEYGLGMRKRWGEKDLFQDTIDQSLEERLPAEKSNAQSIRPHTKSTMATFGKLLWEIISKNPLISGIIALVVGTFLLKLLHLI